MIGRSALQAPRKPPLARPFTNLSNIPSEAHRNPQKAYAAFANKEAFLQDAQSDLPYAGRSQTAARDSWLGRRKPQAQTTDFLESHKPNLFEDDTQQSVQGSRNTRSRGRTKNSKVGDYFRALRESQALMSLGSTQTQSEYLPDTHLKRPLSASNITLPKLLAAQTHLGHATALWHPGNSSYIFGIRDGIHIISLEVTLAYLRRACRVVTEVARRGGLILFVGTRSGFRGVVIKAAQLSGGYHIFDRWTPGSLTNGQQILGKCRLTVVDAMDNEIEKYADRLEDFAVARPDLVIILNPLENEVCLHECGLYNIPTIGIIDTDANSSWVTYPIPANDDSLRSVTLLAMAMGKAGKDGQNIRLELAKQGKLTYRPRDFGDLFEEVEEETPGQQEGVEGDKEPEGEANKINTEQAVLTQAEDSRRSERAQENATLE